MAGMGPAPKPAHLRRRRNAPAHGNGTVIPRLRKGPVPKMPRHYVVDGNELVFSPDARDAWKRWWRDGVATTWAEADWPALTRAIRLYDEWTGGSTRRGLDSELRLTLEGLGLSPKGRLQLRLRYAEPGEESAPKSPGTVTPIKAARSARARIDDDVDDPR